MLTVSPDREVGPPHTKAPSPTSPTRGMEIIRTPGMTRDQDPTEKKPTLKTSLLLMLGCYKILSQEDGLDNNFMNLLLTGIVIAFIALLYHGKVDLENIKLLLETKEQF